MIFRDYLSKLIWSSARPNSSFQMRTPRQCDRLREVKCQMLVSGRAETRTQISWLLVQYASSYTLKPSGCLQLVKIFILLLISHKPLPHISHLPCNTAFSPSSPAEEGCTCSYIETFSSINIAPKKRGEQYIGLSASQSHCILLSLVPQHDGCEYGF